MPNGQYFIPTRHEHGDGDFLGLRAFYDHKIYAANLAPKETQTVFAALKDKFDKAIGAASRNSSLQQFFSSLASGITVNVSYLPVLPVKTNTVSLTRFAIKCNGANDDLIPIRRVNLQEPAQQAVQGKAPAKNQDDCNVQ